MSIHKGPTSHPRSLAFWSKRGGVGGKARDPGKEVVEEL